MKINDFDIQKGIYHFELDELHTEHHSHPVVEIISAIQGTFTVITNEQQWDNLVFAILDSNVTHQIISQNCISNVVMIESNNTLLNTFLKTQNITLKDGVFFKKEYLLKDQVFKACKALAVNKNLRKPKDHRVQQSLEIIENERVEYSTLIASLTSKVFLSESRLSHIFKEQIGTSIKRYLVWNKLKKTILFLLTEDTNLTEAALQYGFFDQAHLSNAFKSTLGVSPSKVYNSRTIQV